MANTILPVELFDFEAMAQFTPENGGDLTIAAVVGVWPTEHLDPETVHKRYI